MDSGLFPDRDLILWIGDHYGPVLAEKVSDLLGADPNGERGFTRAVRRSITNEIRESMRRALAVPTPVASRILTWYDNGVWSP